MTFAEMLTEVNEKWKRAEAQLRQINPVSSVSVSWSTEEGEYKLGWASGTIKLKFPETDSWKPILDCSAKWRLGCMPQYKRLKKSLLEVSETMRTGMEVALSEFESALEDGDA